MAIIVCLGTIASADPERGSAWLAREASAAAARGDCATVGDLARRTSKIDPMYFAETLAGDAAVSACIVDMPSLVRTPTSNLDVALQVGGGAVGTVGGVGLVMTIALGNLVNCLDSDSDRSCKTEGFGWRTAMGLAIGAGAGTGVALAGHHRGSAGAAVLGGLFGGLAASFLQRDSQPDSVNAALFALPTIGAMAGYYSFDL
ncbi:MAG TPA: hypothetical protein VGM39_11905 [Kofleriaceae bacterium]